ncbi:hypothetical protein BDR07DRAFT_52594 [Suillus spraguei]|nr:hypothetical protein BDR07DRAFT_52594 [Suillus spraguei]
MPKTNHLFPSQSSCRQCSCNTGQAGMHYMLLHGRSEIVHVLSLLAVLQHPCNHDLSLYGLISYFFSAVHLLNKRNKHSSNCMVKSVPRYHRILSLPLLRRPRHGHLLHLIRVLPRLVQQPRGHDVFHCGLAWCFFFFVHLLHTMMVIDSNT